MTARGGAFGGGLHGTEQVSWILLVVALCDGALRRAARGLWLATALFPLAVTVQAILGHVGVAGSIAVHVPLGVALFAWSVVLSLRLPRAVPAVGAAAVGGPVGAREVA